MRPSPALQIGYAQNDITPSLDRPVFLAGFDRDRRAQSVHDPLYARALALTGDSRPLVLVALDLIGLGRSLCLDLAARLPGARLVVASTHTHHGPDTLGLWGPALLETGVDPGYIEILLQTVHNTARQALERLHPADVRATSVHVPGLVKNARDPHILDDELSLAQFASTGSEPPVTLAVFPCHPETLWRANPHITSDYPYYLREAVEQATGGACLFFSGALGGMLTPDVEEHTFPEAERIGRTLAEAGLRVLSDAPPAQSDGFAYTRLEFSIPIQSPLLEQAIQVGLVRGALVERGSVWTETSLLRLGAAWLAFVPGELLPKPGLELKERMRRAGAQMPVVVGLANDELGYILPDEDYHYPADPFDPGEHYEETMSIGPHAGSILVAALAGLIEEAAGSQARAPSR